MSVWREAGLVVGKDLRIEARSRVALAQILPFGLIVILLFAFALDPDRGVLPRVAPGLFWIAVLLAALLAIGRAFATEEQHRARDGLRIAGLDGAAIFLGKAAAIAIAPSASSRSAKLRLTGASQPSQCAASTAAIASARRPIMSTCFSTAKSAIR